MLIKQKNGDTQLEIIGMGMPRGGGKGNGAGAQNK